VNRLNTIVKFPGYRFVSFLVIPSEEPKEEHFATTLADLLKKATEISLF